MIDRPPSSTIRKTPGTRERLIDSAAAEFRDPGFFATDTNKIARRAGFSPQTFYRHFRDKVDVFIAVYGSAVAEGEARIARLLVETADSGDTQRLAREILAFLTDWAPFRLALRVLTLENDSVRAARAQNRSAQIDLLAALPTNKGRSRAELFAAIVSVETVCDVIAFDIDRDMKIDRSVWMKEIERAARRLLQPDRQ